MRRLFVVIGLVLLIVGAGLAVYQSSELFKVERTKGSWGVSAPIWPSTLNGTDSPGNRTFWGQGGMSLDSWFELSLSFSGPLRVTVAALTNPTSPSGGSLTPVFNEVGTVFSRIVRVGEGTWQVDIINEGLTPVDIVPGSSVVAKENLADVRLGYPYSLPGTLLASAGVVVLIVGVVSKGKVKRKKA